MDSMVQLSIIVNFREIHRYNGFHGKFIASWRLRKESMVIMPEGPKSVVDLTLVLDASNCGFSSMCWSSLPGVQMTILHWAIRLLSKCKSLPPMTKPAEKIELKFRVMKCPMLHDLLPFREFDNRL